MGNLQIQRLDNLNILSGWSRGELSGGGLVSSERCNVNPCLEVLVVHSSYPGGPGRRPKSLARQRFVELIAQGVPFRVAAIEVGVSRSAAQIWKNGTLLDGA